MVDVKVDQGGIYALAEATPPIRVDQGGIYALAKTAPPVRVDQGGIVAFVAITPVVPVAQAGMYALAGSSPCATKWAQIWTIARTDGEIYRFTSLDRDLVFGGVTYKACGSLDPSASENVAAVDQAGSMDLGGGIGDAEGQINSWDLYAGRFDGAEVEAWLVPWSGEGSMRRLLRGTMGAVSLGETGFSVDLQGDGVKLQQTPLVFLLQPGCRWRFGDPLTCGKDLAPLTVTGTIDSGDGSRAFIDTARVEAAGYFKFGRVTFTGGDNAGISAEIKEHISGGHFTLWPRLPFPVSAGDPYSMTPGCTNLKDPDGGCNGCTAWGQLTRYGGFDKVPGRDKRNKAADVRSS